MEIWQETDGILLIGDMEKPRHLSPDAIIKSLKKICKLFGFNSIYFEISPNSIWHNLVEVIESSKAREPVYFYPISDANKN